MELHNQRRLNRQDYKTLALAALGGALEFYDFIIFVFFATVVGALFFPPDMPEWLRLVQTFGIFAAGYLARPLGGIIMAHFGDRIGRKKMFSLSILLMALPTLLMGMLPTYQSIGIVAPLLLLLMRVLQGAAIGGEVPGAWVFVAEHVPPQRIGFACGVLTSGLTFGILLGSLVATWLNSWLTPQEVLNGGWRIPFFLGGLFGLMAMYLRRWLHETPVFLEMQARRALAAELPLKSVVRDHRRAVVVSMLLTWLLSAGIVVVILMTPSLLQAQYHLPAALTLQANSVAIITLTLGCVLAGSLVDSLGAGRLFIGWGVLLAVCTWQFFSRLSPEIEPVQLFWRYGLAGFSVGLVGAVPFIMVCAFPAEVRFSGISFSYNLAYAIFGGLTPIVVTLLLTLTPLAAGWYVLTLSLLGVALGFYFQRSPLRAAEGEIRLSR